MAPEAAFAGVKAAHRGRRREGTAADLYPAGEHFRGRSRRGSELWRRSMAEASDRAELTGVVDVRPGEIVSGRTSEPAENAGGRGSGSGYHRHAAHPARRQTQAPDGLPSGALFGSFTRASRMRGAPAFFLLPSSLPSRFAGRLSAPNEIRTRVTGLKNIARTFHELGREVFFPSQICHTHSSYHAGSFVNVPTRAKPKTQLHERPQKLKIPSPDPDVVRHRNQYRN